MSRKQVYVVKYETKHGTDTIICECKLFAKRAVLQIMYDNLGDLEEYDPKGAALVAKALPNVDKALEIFNGRWCETSTSDPEYLEYDAYSFCETSLQTANKLMKMIKDEYNENDSEDDGVDSAS